MKNTINYYYNILLEDFVRNDNGYYFYLNNEEYHLVVFDRPYEDIEPIYKLNLEMKKNNCLVHDIILNKDKKAITIINNTPYVLLKLCKYKNEKVFLNDLNYIQHMTYNIEYNKSLLRTDWVRMWSQKIDYYEYQISQFSKKYPILCDSLSYFIGLGENAISYIVNNSEEENISPVVSHKRIKRNNGSFEFYNPLNFVIDSRVRDIAEYIKDSYMINELDFYEIKSFLDINKLSNNEYKLLFARLLFPTFYFDIYDDIINNNMSEEKILSIIERTCEYEEILVNIYKYIVNDKKINLQQVEWLIKRHSS